MILLSSAEQKGFQAKSVSNQTLSFVVQFVAPTWSRGRWLDFQCFSLQPSSDSAVKVHHLSDLSLFFVFSVMCQVNHSGQWERMLGGRGQPDCIIWPPVIICAGVWRSRGVFTLFGCSSGRSARESLSQSASELAHVASPRSWRTMVAPPSNIPPPSPPTRLGDCEGSGLISVCRILTVWPSCREGGATIVP